MSLSVDDVIGQLRWNNQKLGHCLFTPSGVAEHLNERLKLKASESEIRERLDEIVNCTDLLTKEVRVDCPLGHTIFRCSAAEFEERKDSAPSVACFRCGDENEYDPDDEDTHNVVDYFYTLKEDFPEPEDEVATLKKEITRLNKHISVFLWFFRLISLRTKSIQWMIKRAQALEDAFLSGKEPPDEREIEGD